MACLYHQVGVICEVKTETFVSGLSVFALRVFCGVKAGNFASGLSVYTRGVLSVK